MTISLKERVARLEVSIQYLAKKIDNHCAVHKWDRIVSFGILALQIAIILLLKFKVL